MKKSVGIWSTRFPYSSVARIHNSSFGEACLSAWTGLSRRGTRMGHLQYRSGDDLHRHDAV
jgi:hypothetical protein